MRQRSVALAIAGALVVGLAIGLAVASQASSTFPIGQWLGMATGQPARVFEGERFSESSKNVFRVSGTDVYRTAVAVSQLVYPGPRTDAHPDAQPGVAILVPARAGSEPLYAEALAAAALVHHPRNGPILFTDPDKLNADTAAELQRLNPTGGPDWPPVFIVGRISPAVEDEVTRMGFRTERLSGATAAETASRIDERVGRPEHVLIVRSDDPSHGLPSVSWIAHMGDSTLLFAERDGLPEATVQALRARQGPVAVHILGPETYLSATVEQQLRGIVGPQAVDRIAGDTPAATAVAFAKYKQGDFGWGLTSAGHGFAFTTVDRWQNGVAAALTAHLGGHGPLLYADPNGLPRETRDYLESVRPTFPNEDPTQARYNRGYLIASPDTIGDDQQAEIDWLLESVPATGGHMPGMHGRQEAPGE